MNNINNFYKLFDVLQNASTKEIIMAYENKITKYNNIEKLSNEQVYNIKMLKIGLYILINPKLRKKYNETTTINNNANKPKDNEYKEVNKPDKPNKPNKPNKSDKPDNEPIAINSLNDDTLDSLFNVDNSWMNKVNVNSESSQTNKKNNFDTNIGDRVFSLSDINKRPGFSADFESDIRKPMQGREDKSAQILNKNKM